MTRVTVAVLGREVEAELKGTLWEQGQQYYVVQVGESEYRVEPEDIAGEVPPVPRLDTDTERRIDGTLVCPNCRSTREYSGRYEGRLTCEECAETAGIDRWKAATPGNRFEYTVAE
jgi:hypothetical protein